MEMLEQSLEGSVSHAKQETEEVVQLQEGEAVGADGQSAVTITTVPQAAFTDHGVQYQFRTENNGGQVTYRVVQVTEDQLEATADATGAVSVVSAAAFAGAPQAVAQAVIQNSFSNGGSPGGDAVGGETRFAYFPAAAVSDGTAVSVQGADPAITQAGGQFYVMMSPSEVLQTASPRTIAPRTHTYTTGEKKTRQDQQLDRHAVQADPGLQRGHQNRSEQRRHPVEGLRLHPGAAAEQPAAAGRLQGGGAGGDGQRAAQATDGGAEERERSAPSPAAAARRGGQRGRDAAVSAGPRSVNTTPFIPVDPSRTRSGHGAAPRPDSSSPAHGSQPPHLGFFLHSGYWS
uniref:Upstream transcription factor 2, c-fos interacting n=1 Tax=Poecilia reticulata TaxID=8081 RepID=A0A3P9NVF6_POERE